MAGRDEEGDEGNESERREEGRKRERRREGVVHFLRSGPPFSIRSSSDKGKEGRMINTSVIISLQIFRDASRYANAG